MSVREYIGARYVPTFGRKDEESITWDNTGTYEPLTVVLYQGNSYTSRQYVPAGIEIDNEAYWAQTGNYNAQVEQYRQEVTTYAESVETLESSVSTVSDNLAAEVTARETLETNFEVLENYQDGFMAECAPIPYMQYKHSIANKQLQGGCIFNNGLYMALAVPIDQTAYIYLFNNNTKEIIATNTVNAFGHANDMTYNSTTNQIIVAGCDIEDGQTWKVYALNAQTLIVENTYTPSVNFYQIAYDADNNCYYAGHGNRLYVLASDFTVTNTFTLNTENVTTQGICYDGKYIFMLIETGHKIAVIKPSNGMIVAIINVALYGHEMEWIDVIDKKFYIAITGAIDTYYYSMVYTTALYAQAHDLNERNTASDYNRNIQQNIYVDYSEDINYGDGYSNSSPVNSFMAINATRINAERKWYYVTGDGNEYITFAGGNGELRIVGNSNDARLNHLEIQDWAGRVNVYNGITLGSCNVLSTDVFIITNVNFEGSCAFANSNVRIVKASFNNSNGFAFTAENCMMLLWAQDMTIADGVKAPQVFNTVVKTRQMIYSSTTKEAYGSDAAFDCPLLLATETVGVKLWCGGDTGAAYGILTRREQGVYTGSNVITYSGVLLMSPGSERWRLCNCVLQIAADGRTVTNLSEFKYLNAEGTVSELSQVTGVAELYGIG